MKQSDNDLIIRTIVVDDEPLARSGLCMRLEKYPQIQVVQSCQNGKEALAAIAEQAPDLVFLDIQMPGFTGFDVVKKLQQDNMPAIVFVTAYDAFAVDAFTVNAVDYLLKPVEDERLQQTIVRVTEHVSRKEAAMEKHRLLDIVIALTGKSRSAVTQLLQGEGATSHYSDRIAIKDGSSTTFVPVKDIDWVDAAGDYMCVHVGGQTHIMRTTMKELEAQLDPNIFQRVHRSTIVNLHRVEKVSSHINGEFHLTLSNGSSLKMSRSYKDKVKHFF